MALLHRIKETLREEVKDLSWMEARTKRKTLEKLEHLREYVGLVEGIIDITNLDAAYKNYVSVRSIQAIYHYIWLGYIIG